MVPVHQEGDESESELERASVPPGLDPHAHEAVVAELNRIDASENWAAPEEPVTSGHRAPTAYQEGAPQRGYRPPDPPTPHGDGPHIRSLTVSPEARVTHGPRVPKTLEDLYAIFPHIGNGVFFLRVIRKEPKLFRGVKVSGWIDDVHEQITLSQFRDRYGGERFVVAVLGPRTPKDAAERPTVQQLAEMDVQIPGPPAYGSLPQPDEEDIMTTRQPIMGRPQMGYGGGFSDPQVEVKKLEVEAERDRREFEASQALQRQVLERGGSPDAAAKVAAETTARALDDAKEVSGRLTDLMRGQIVEHQRRIADLSDDLKTASEELIKAKAEAAQALYHGETKAVIELRERQNKEMSDVKDRTSKELSDAKERASRDLQEATGRLQAEMNALKDRHADELKRVRDETAVKLEVATKDTSAKLDEASRSYRERAEHLERTFERERGQLRDDHQARELRTKDDYERAEKNFKEAYENRIRDLERQTKREIDAVIAERDVRIKAIESQYTGQVSFTEKTTQMQLDTMTRENARLETKLEAAEAELQRARDKLNKDVPTALAEAQQLATMTGWGPQGGETKEEEGEFDWKKSLAKAGMALVEKSPELMQKLGEIRAQNAPVASAAPPQVALGQASGRPGAPAQQRPRGQLAPPPGMGMRPMPPMGGSGGRPFVVAPPAPATAHPGMGRGAVVFGPQGHGSVEPPAIAAQPMPPFPVQQPAVPAANGAPAAGDAMPQWMPAPHAPMSPIQPQGGAPSPAAANGAPPAGGPAIQGLTEAHIGEFVGELENAIRGNVVSAGGFANLFIGRIGPELAMQVLAGVDPDQLIQLIQNTPGAEQSQIVTRGGQKYVRAVWDELRKQLSGQVAPGAPT